MPTNLPVESKGYVFCRNRHRFDSYVAGLDIGSGLSKAVILQDGRLLSSAVRPTEGDFILAADRVLSGALEKARLTQSDIEYIGACGLGTRFIP